MRIAAVGRALPHHYYDQETLLARLEREWSTRHYNVDRLRRLHENVLVGGRHLAIPLEQYDRLDGFGSANDTWIEVATELGTRALAEGLTRAGLAAADVDALYFTSVTGIATPSIDARLMNRLPLPANTKRVPMFGLGCVAGAAGIARCADYLRGHPDQVAVLLSVELCSLTLQREDLSIPNLIASGLFGDGAAAAVTVGEERASPAEDRRESWRAAPRVVASRSVFYRDSEEVMGWRISERGFEVVLSADVPRMVLENLRADVDGVLAEHGLERGDIEHWICHPGGPRVLEAMQQALELPEAALERTWRSLREVGNLSSTSILLVLEEVLGDAEAPRSESWGVMLAMGPGFCSEIVLLRWS